MPLVSFQRAIGGTGGITGVGASKEDEAWYVHEGKGSAAVFSSCLSDPEADRAVSEYMLHHLFVEGRGDSRQGDEHSEVKAGSAHARIGL